MRPSSCCNGFQINQTGAGRLSSLPKHLMDKRDRDRAFADRGRDSLDVAAANVSSGKDAWTAGFEQIRWSRERPLRIREIVGREIRARFHEAFVVQPDAPVQPAGVGN